MEEQSTVELMRKGYECMATGDMETLRSELLHPDIVWHQAGDNPTSGDYQGVEQVLGLFLNLFQVTDGSFQVHLDSIAGTDDLVFGIGGASATRNGATLANEPYAHVARVRDGKMAEAWIINLDQPKVDRFYNS